MLPKGEDERECSESISTPFPIIGISINKMKGPQKFPLELICAPMAIFFKLAEPIYV